MKKQTSILLLSLTFLFQELIDKCTWTWTTLNGKKGYNVKGQNGNTIFFPAAGFKYKNGKIWFGKAYFPNKEIKPSSAETPYTLAVSAARRFCRRCNCQV